MVSSVGPQSPAPTQAALEPLCRAYSYPVYAYIRRRGIPHHEAGALIQGFFARLRQTGGAGRGDAEHGRFRTFLLTAVAHHLDEAAGPDHAAGRECGEARLTLDLNEAGDRFDREPADPGLTPEEAFDRDWAMDTIARAIGELQSEYTSARRGPILDVLGPFVWGGSVAPPQAEAAAELGMTEHAFTVTVHRLRHHLRDHLRALVCATVGDPAQVDSELRFLLAVVRRRPVAV